jgi:hypothetical protein
MIVVYIILTMILLYVDAMLQSAGFSAMIATVLLVAVLYKIGKLTDTVAELKKKIEELEKKNDA